MNLANLKIMQVKHSIKLFITIIFLALTQLAQSQEPDSTEKMPPKKGLSFTTLPVVAYDSDLGFRYGGVLGLYHYGDGARYPRYDHSLYLEWSRTTKGSGTNQMIYDSDRLISGLRTTFETTLYTELAQDFYGYNGYKTLYNADFEDDSHSDYISRMYYKYGSSTIRLRADFQKNIGKTNFLLFGGIDFYGTRNIATVDIENLNANADSEDQLPDVDLLYDKYVEWGVIPQNEKNGGDLTFLRAGLIYDTRDNEPSPMRGIWTEILISTAPKFASPENFSYTKIALTHRQYFTLVPKNLNLACRFGYQALIHGEIPFFMLPVIFSSKLNRNGLGGAKTLRGILRNRIVGEDYLYGNIELRWKFHHTVIFNQNMYFALSGYFDYGVVTHEFSPDLSKVPNDYRYYFDSGTETIHPAIGAGIQVVINANFVLTLDFGKALDKRDGKQGIYLQMNYLF